MADERLINIPPTGVTSPIDQLEWVGKVTYEPHGPFC